MSHKEGAADEKVSEHGLGFPKANGCLMIFGGTDDTSFSRQCKLHLREVCTLATAIPKILNWSGTPITFDCNDHPSVVP